MCFELVGIRGSVSRNLGTVALIVYNFLIMTYVLAYLAIIRLFK
jgi:hypothetical protein